MHWEFSPNPLLCTATLAGQWMQLAFSTERETKLCTRAAANTDAMPKGETKRFSKPDAGNLCAWKRFAVPFNAPGARQLGAGRVEVVQVEVWLGGSLRKENWQFPLRVVGVTLRSFVPSKSHYLYSTKTDFYNGI